MSKREHSFTVRYTDEEFDLINSEYQQQLARVLVGVHFTMSDMLRIKTLATTRAQDKHRQTLSDTRRIA